MMTDWRSRRRSDRLQLTLPIRVVGSDVRGRRFGQNTRTVMVSRHGARILLKHAVFSGESLRVTNRLNNRGADFRLVEPARPEGNQTGDWGVACRDEKENIWDIEFPSPTHAEGTYGALLECRRCRRVALTYLLPVELDALWNEGFLTQVCKFCGRPANWGFSQLQAALPLPGEDKEGTLEEFLETPPPLTNRRASFRAPVQLPLRVRTSSGANEITESEDLSKSGLAFISDKYYEVGEEIWVTCPYQPYQKSIEVHARIMRRTDLKSTHRRVIGVQFEPND